MTAKDVRKLIITLIILVIGINILGYMANNYIPKIPNTISGTATDISPALNTLTTVISLGLGVLVLILIPVYFSKRSEEKYKHKDY